MQFQKAVRPLRGEISVPGCNSASFIEQVTVNDVFFLRWSIGRIFHGIPVFAGTLKHIVELVAFFVVNQVFCLDEKADIGIQHI